MGHAVPGPFGSRALYTPFLPLVSYLVMLTRALLPLRLTFFPCMTYADHIASGRCIKFIEDYMAQEARLL